MALRQTETVCVKRDWIIDLVSKDVSGVGFISGEASHISCLWSGDIYALVFTIDIENLWIVGSYLTQRGTQIQSVVALWDQCNTNIDSLQDVCSYFAVDFGLSLFFGEEKKKWQG